MSNQIRFIDLFAGIGGMRLGLEQSLKEKNIDFKCVFTSEIKSHAVKVYNENFPDTKISGDITQISSKDIPDFDIMLAGFPCQPFSSAGKQLGFEDTRGTLFFEIARILKDKKPTYFLLENVDNLLIHNLSKEDKKNGEIMGNTLKTILNVLKNLGYNVSWKVLAASDFGVPQIRKRIYIIGSLISEINLDNFPITHKTFGDIQEKNLQCIDNEFSQKIISFLEKESLPLSHLYDKSIRDKRGGDNNLHSWFLELRGTTNKSQCELLEKMVTERRKKDLAKKKGVPIKDGVGLDIEELKALYNGQHFMEDINDLLSKGYLKHYRINTYPKTLYDIVCGRLSFQYTKFLDPNKLALTLVATDIIHTGVVDQNGIRNLTITECLRLNGFPDNFIINVTYRQALDLLGNTVVIPVIKNICDRIFTVAQIENGENKK